MRIVSCLAVEKGEADRILKVKAAEGDAQSKALQGRAGALPISGRLSSRGCGIPWMSSSGPCRARRRRM